MSSANKQPPTKASGTKPSVLNRITNAVGLTSSSKPKPTISGPVPNSFVHMGNPGAASSLANLPNAGSTTTRSRSGTLETAQERVNNYSNSTPASMAKSRFGPTIATQLNYRRTYYESPSGKVINGPEIQRTQDAINAGRITQSDLVKQYGAKSTLPNIFVYPTTPKATTGSSSPSTSGPRISGVPTSNTSSLRISDSSQQGKVRSLVDLYNKPVSSPMPTVPPQTSDNIEMIVKNLTDLLGSLLLHVFKCNKCNK